MSATSPRSSSSRVAPWTIGKIDILCANAGMAAWVSALETTERQWREMIDVNLTGAFLTVKAVAPHMVDRRQGCIILTSSVNGREAAMGLTHTSRRSTACSA